MTFDLRLPIGLLFTLLGLLLSVFGLLSPPELYQRSLGTNMNLWWGLAILAFGAVMLAFALRARRAASERGRQ